MSNMESTRVLSNYIESLIDLLEKGENTDLYATERCSDLKKVRRDYKSALEREADKGRNLSIGIIGDIKAGKSTFLNALVFDGKDVLPKAVTPMTAALTKITYSKTPKAIIHFYSSDDWDSIERDSNEYDRLMEEAYEKYKENYDIKVRGGNVNIGKPKTRDEFIKSSNGRVDERYRSAKELTDKVNGRHDVLDKLGESVQIKYNTMSDLDNYVGAEGTYTPIVNYVELQVNDKALNGFEIVDTPGLNDPVKSRSMKTKDFLSQCDVAIILSPVGQFLPAGTMRNINLRLPSEGIEHFLIIGSRIDEGIRQIPEMKKQKTFKQAYQLCVSDYMESYKKNIGEVTKEGIVGGVGMYGEPIFISSSFYTMYLKIKNGQPLSEEEKCILENIKNNYPDFATDANSLRSYSKLENVKKKLREFSAEKATIIEERSNGIVNTYITKVSGIVDALITDTVSRLNRLRTFDIEELRTRMNEATHAVDSTRTRISSEFNNAANESSGKIYQIKAILQDEMSRHTDFITETSKSREEEVTRRGIFGIIKHVDYYDVTHHHASVSEIDKNINSYMAKCNENIKLELDHLLEKDSIKKKITSIMLNAFEKAGGNIEEDDIIAPLRELFSRITIPNVNISPYQYIDEVHTEFTSGVANDEEIYVLANLQQRVLTKIYEEYSNQLDKCSVTIRNTLEEQARKFADDLESRIRGELEILSKQADEKEMNVNRYEMFLKDIKDSKNTYKEI